MIKFALLFAIVPAIGMIAGCETTGDPRAGGLFYWSESKAQRRQVELTETAGQAIKKRNDEMELAERSREQKSALQNDVSTLQTRLDNLLQENRQLKEQYLALSKTRKFQSAKLQRLTRTLEGKLSPDLMRNEYLQHSTPEWQNSYLKGIEATNNEYKEAILMLLKY